MVFVVVPLCLCVSVVSSSILCHFECISVSVDTVLLTQIPPGQAESGSPLTAVPPVSSVSTGAQSLAVFNVADMLAKTRQAWVATPSVRTSDATVQEIFDKARFGLAAMVADNGVMDAGIFEYGSQWVRDTSNTLLGLVHAGHFELARRGFAHVLEQMVNEEGCTMIARGFDSPDREQSDQVGELLHALKAYRDWTGDDSLIREHRAKLLAMVERPLRPEFRDQTGMVHNRREFWERTLDEAYELAYQTYVILGLRDAAAVAEPLGAADRAERWLSEAGRIPKAAFELPGRAWVENGRLIKRRAVNGEPVRTILFGASAALEWLNTVQGAEPGRGSRQFPWFDPRRRPRASFRGPPAKSACSLSAACWVFALKEIRSF